MDLIEMFLRQVVLVAIIWGSTEAAWNVTCDLDLENIEEIVQYLPIECQEIYKTGANSELYATSLKESQKFQQFREQLDAYERKESSMPVGEIPTMNEALRFEIYNKTMLSDCSNRTDSLPEAAKTNEFYNCLLTKRVDMINLIPQ